MISPVRLAFLAIDKREFLKNYSKEVPTFHTALEALLQGFAGLEGVEVHVISCLQHPVRTVEKLAPNIFSRALHVPKLGWMRTCYQGCVRAVRRDLAALRPDIVHGQGAERDCALSAVFSGYPNLITIHGNMRRVAKVNRAPPFSFHWLAARLEAFAVRRTDGVICISEYTRMLVKGEARQTWLVPNPVDVAFFEVPRATQPQHFLVAGTICSHKNQNHLIQSLDPLATEGGLRVHFVGDYAKDAHYPQEFFKLISSRPWCSFSGFANRARMKELLSETTALLLPSLEDNCPMVVLEAAAAGVPAIGSSIGGIPGLIDDGATGFLVPANDGRAWHEAVRRLVRHPEAAKSMGEAAKKKMLQHFSPANIARRHLEIYREVLSVKR